MNYIKKLDIYSVVITLLTVLLILGSLWQWAFPAWLKLHDAQFQVSVSADVQKQILQAGAQQGQLQTLLQMRDAVASGKEINIQVADPADSKQYNFTLVAKPQASSTK